MFTQLDLFGDLPAPEKPSNQPPRTEKKSAARSGSSAQSTQTQLSMGLPETEFPEPSAAWTGSEQDVQTPEVSEHNTSAPADQDTKATGVSEAKGNADPIAAPQTGPEYTGTTTNKPAGAISSDLKISSHGEVSSPADNGNETRAEKGRRYYIQTEIPADPPLPAKPPGPEAMLASLISTRNTTQEARPRYIQTEIPSDPIEAPSLTQATHTETSTEIPRSENVGVESGSGSPAATSPVQEAPASATDSDHRNVPLQAIAPEALRRTRPLMPPKVILADQEEEMTKSVAEKSPEPGDKSKGEFTTSEKRPVQSFAPEKDAIPNPASAIFEANATPGMPVVAESPDPGENEHATETAASIEAALPESTIPGEPEPVLETATTIEAALPESKDPEEAEPALEVGSSLAKGVSRRKRTVREPIMERPGPGIPADDQLNARQYYTIGEVATMFGVKASLLRYWESEFDVLKLRKNRKGDRFFRPDDIRSLQLIHHLLRDKKYTIEGAREYMRNAGKMKEKFETIETLKRIRLFLVEMRNGLQADKVRDDQ